MDPTLDPSIPSVTVAGMLGRTAVCEALDSGTDGMRSRGKTYLPQWPQEVDSAWVARRDSSTLFPGFANTLDTMVGRPFGEPVVVETGASIEANLENVDMAGRDLDTFARDVFRDALKHGIAWILVDFPKTQPAPNLQVERASGARPYWVHIPLSRIIGWRTENQAGRIVPTLVRVLESVEVPNGRWGTAVEERVRVLTPGNVQVWVKRGDEWVLTEDVPVSLQEIPMVPVYTGRTGFWTADPPLLDLAWKNIEHWQSSSDQRNILHVARVPFLASDNDVRDDPNAPVTLKASGIITGFENLRFVEHSGAAIGAGRTDLMDLEDQMRRLAGELLARNTGDKTATETGLEASQGAAWLKAKVRTYQDALEECLRLHGAWIKDATPSTVTINCEWDDEALQADMITALTALRTAGGMSQDSLIWNMEKGGLLPPGRNIEEEKSLIEAEGPSGMEMLDSPSNLPPKKPKTVKITRPNGSVSTVSME